MKKLPLILSIVALSLMFGCGKTSDPTPSTSVNFGSWAYKGTSYTGTYSSWSGNNLTALADKPHLSSLQAYFSSNAPTTGNYTFSSDPKTSGLVAIGLVDSALPAISYASVADKNAGTVSVSQSGSTTTVTITNVLLIGFKADATPDSVVVTGTIVK